MRQLEIVERELNLLAKRELELLEEQDTILRETLVQCGSEYKNRGCGKETPIKGLVYIQTLFYVRPRGCTEGDYWSEGEGGFDCPHCGLRNRLYKYNRPEIQKLRRLFLRVEECPK